MLYLKRNICLRKANEPSAMSLRSRYKLKDLNTIAVVSSMKREMRDIENVTRVARGIL